MKRTLLFGSLLLTVLAVTAGAAQAAASVDSVGCSPEPSFKNQSATCSASYSGIDAKTCSVDFGDGNVVAGTLVKTGKNAGTCSAENVYDSKGDYTVTVTVWDKKMAHSASNSGGHTVKRQRD